MIQIPHPQRAFAWETSVLLPKSWCLQEAFLSAEKVPLKVIRGTAWPWPVS